MIGRLMVKLAALGSISTSFSLRIFSFALIVAFDLRTSGEYKTSVLSSDAIIF